MADTNVGNYSQAYLQHLLDIAALNAQNNLDVANIGAGASRYAADINLLINKMQLAYSYYRLKALEIPQALASDDLARHQLAINAAVQFAQLSGWVNPMDFDTRRVMEHAMNKQGQQINNAPVSADQMLQSADMKPIMAEAKANGWGDADPESILTVWVQNNDGNESMQESIDKAKRILETDMGTYVAAAKQGDLYSQQKVVKNAYYVNRMNLSPTNSDPIAVKQEVQKLIDEKVTIPATKTEMVPVSQATPEQRAQMAQGINTSATQPTQQPPQMFSTKEMLNQQAQTTQPPQFNPSPAQVQTPTPQQTSNINAESLAKKFEKPPVWG